MEAGPHCSCLGGGTCLPQESKEQASLSHWAAPAHSHVAVTPVTIYNLLLALTPHGKRTLEVEEEC